MEQLIHVGLNFHAQSSDTPWIQIALARQLIGTNFICTCWTTHTHRCNLYLVGGSGLKRVTVIKMEVWRERFQREPWERVVPHQGFIKMEVWRERFRRQSLGWGVVSHQGFTWRCERKGFRDSLGRGVVSHQGCIKIEVWRERFQRRVVFHMEFPSTFHYARVYKNCWRSK